MMARRAALILRHSESYRRDQFAIGLRRLGFEVADHTERRPHADDLLVLWNRRRASEPDVLRYQAAGAPVIIAENGYLPSAAAKQFALALNAHNGAGRWWIGPSPRFAVDLAPWRAQGEHILVLLQRGIGEQGVAMPTGWPSMIARRLADMTDRKIIVRRHPGMRGPPLAPDLVNAWAAVTWGSGAGVKAIAAGVPVFHDFGRWIGAAASKPLFNADLEDPFLGDREEFLRHITWAQWSVDEIANGHALEMVLQCHVA